MTPDSLWTAFVRPRSRLPRLADLGLSLVVAAGLVIDCVVHARLAPDRDGIGTSVTQGTLFRVEAAVAALVALLVVVLPRRRLAYALAFAVAAAAITAVMVYRYVDLGQIGPLPDMYEPVWYGEKTLSAYAEGVAALAALIGVLCSCRRSDGG